MMLRIFVGVGVAAIIAATRLALWLGRDTPERAAEWLASQHGVDPRLILDDPGYYQEAYRRYAARTHPDGGKKLPEEWNRLQDVKRLLDAHHLLNASGAIA